MVINLNKSEPKQTPVNSFRLKDSAMFRRVLKAGKACGKCGKSLPKLWPFNIRRSDDEENRIKAERRGKFNLVAGLLLPNANGLESPENAAGLKTVRASEIQIVGRATVKSV